jgi:uncharacterized delta-60 repeat protein
VLRSRQTVGAAAASVASLLVAAGCGFGARGASQAPAAARTPSAAPAAPSAGFDRSGLVTTALSGQSIEAQAMTVAAAGRITVAGSGFSDAHRRQTFTIVRYTPDGRRDASFGTDGVVTELRRDRDANDVSEDVSMVAQPDGKLVVAGLVGVRGMSEPVDAIEVRRYLPDGALDRSFGINGRRTIPFVGETVCGVWQQAALALGPANTILVAGSQGCGGEGPEEKDLVGARLLADGRMDESFGPSGVQRPRAPASGDGVAAQPDGSIVLAGSDNGTQVFATGRLTVIRLRPDGSPDPTFGVRGRPRFRFAGFELSSAAELAVDAKGRIVVAGTGFNASETRSAIGVVRLLADGRGDRAFHGTATITLTPRRGWQASATAVALSPDGSVVVAGNQRRRATGRVVVARVNEDGSPDNRFGTGGQRTVDFRGTWDEAEDVAVLPDGSTIVAGSTRRGHGRSRIALARLAPT